MAAWGEQCGLVRSQVHSTPSLRENQQARAAGLLISSPSCFLWRQKLMVATFKGQPSTIGMNHPLLCTEMDAESEMVVDSDNR